MFKDYYKILGISNSACFDDIKSAYRDMSRKWHPDLNPNTDVTSIMQDINEAYAILKDEAKRLRYDQEYNRFNKKYTNQCNCSNTSKNYKQKESSIDDWNYNYDYDVQDENLKEDINSAREYAKSLVEEFMKTFKESSIAAIKGAATNAAIWTIGWIVSGIIISLLGILIKSCN